MAGKAAASSIPSKCQLFSLPLDWTPPSSKTPEGQRRLAIVIADMISRGKNRGEHHFARIMQTMYAASLEAPPIADILDEMVSMMLSRDQMDKIFTAGRGMGVGRDLARFLFPEIETAAETEDEAGVSMLDLWGMVGVLETRLSTLIRGYEQPGGPAHQDNHASMGSRSRKKKNRKKKKNRGKDAQAEGQQEQVLSRGSPSPVDNQRSGQQQPKSDVEPALAERQFQSLDAVIERREALIAGMRAILEDYRKPQEGSGLDEVD